VAGLDGVDVVPLRQVVGVVAVEEVVADARLDEVLELLDPVGAVELEHALRARVEVDARLEEGAHRQLLARVLHHEALVDLGADDSRVVDRLAEAHPRGDGEQPGGRERVRDPGQQVEALPLGADLAHEVVVRAVQLEQKPGQPRERLLEGVQAELGEPVELDRLLGREVLVEEQPAEEVPLLPALRQGDVRLEALPAPLVERVAELAEEVVVADAGDVGPEDHPRRDDLLVPEARDPAVGVVVSRLLVVEVEPVELSPRALRPHVAIRRPEAEPALLEVGGRHRQVLAVAEDEVDRLPDEEALLVAAAERRGQEPGVPVLAEARREEGDERDERDPPDPERRVGAPHVVVEVRGGGPEAHRPGRGLVLAGREDAARDAVGLVAEPLHAVAAEEEVRLGGRLRLVHDARRRPQVVLDPLAGQPIPAVEQHHPPGRDGLARLGVDLDPVGLQAHVALLDLDVALGDQELLAVQPLDTIGVDGDRGAGLEREALALLALAETETRKEGEREDDYEPDQTECGHGPPPRRSGPPTRSVRRVHSRSDAELGTAGILSEASRGRKLRNAVRSRDSAVAREHLSTEPAA
jgi:hypothetical protein